MKRILISLCIPFLVCVFASNSYADEVTIDWGEGSYTGEVSDGVPHGQGTWTTPGGDEYVGEWKDGLRHGQGTLTYADASQYIGEWKDGFAHGQGTLTFSDGYKYVGEFKDGLFHGQGTYTEPGGSKYVGEWKDANWHGQGTLTFSDGRTYVGEFKNDLYDGQGTVTFSDGRKYAGQFKDNKFDGLGTLAYPSGEKYVGEFKGGNFDGQGTQTRPDGRKYVGEWKDGDWHGQGTQTWPDGEKYVGGFEEGWYHGQGTLTYADGDKYVGEWQYGSRHGQGTLTFPDGRKYVGEFKNDLIFGQGTVTFPDGKRYVGEFKQYAEPWQGIEYDKDGNVTATFSEGVDQAVSSTESSTDEIQERMAPITIYGKTFTFEIPDGYCPLDQMDSQKEHLVEILNWLNEAVRSGGFEYYTLLHDCYQLEQNLISGTEITEYIGLGGLLNSGQKQIADVNWTPKTFVNEMIKQFSSTGFDDEYSEWIKEVKELIDESQSVSENTDRLKEAMADIAIFQTPKVIHTDENCIYLLEGLYFESDNTKRSTFTSMCQLSNRLINFYLFRPFIGSSRDTANAVDVLAQFKNSWRLE